MQKDYGGPVPVVSRDTVCSFTASFGIWLQPNYNRGAVLTPMISDVPNKDVIITMRPAYMRHYR